MKDELKAAEQYLTYLSVKGESLENEQERLTKRLREIADELEIIDKETIETFRKAQHLMLEKAAEELAT